MWFEGIDVPPGTDVKSISLSPADLLGSYTSFRTRFAVDLLAALTSTERLFVYGPCDPAISLYIITPSWVPHYIIIWLLSFEKG